VYRLTTQAESNDKGKWFGWEVEKVGAVEDMNAYALPSHLLPKSTLVK
jgi:hypothetical protein